MNISHRQTHVAPWDRMCLLLKSVASEKKGRQVRVVNPAAEEGTCFLRAQSMSQAGNPHCFSRRHHGTDSHLQRGVGWSVGRRGGQAAPATALSALQVPDKRAAAATTTWPSTVQNSYR